MRRRSVIMVLILGCLASNAPVAVYAQDQTNNPDALKKELADSLGQLKAAQDRKNELANENEKLKAQIAAMQKQLEDLQRASASWAEETYATRAREAAWNAMLAADSNLKARWEILLETFLPELTRDISQWSKVTPATSPTTSPTTAPATTSTTQK